MKGKHYNRETKDSTENKNNKSIKLKIIKALLILLLIVVMLLGIGTGGAIWFISDKFNKMQLVELNDEDLGIDKGTKDSLSGYRNIALFGVDSRNNNLEKGNRSDCIIIASINNNTKDIRLISVYRDSYVQIDGHGLDKITHAYSYGSAQLAIKTLNTNLDLNIKEFVTVNFDAVVEAVDKLGGITLNISSNKELKYLNSIIDETAKVTGKSNEKLTKTGIQTVNGVQAVAYSRIRYTSGGDYKRTERMRNVIEAMLKKLKTKSIGELNYFVDFILPKVYTNITSKEILKLLPSATNFKITESIGWPYETKGITLDRWYGVPITLESNVQKLHTEIFKKDNYIVPDKIKTISNSIIKKTGYK